MKYYTAFSSLKFITLVLLLLFKVHNDILYAQNFPLYKQIVAIENHLDSSEAVNEDVSKAPVKWHLLHALQVINVTYQEALQSNEINYSTKRNIKWHYVSMMGRIPRGTVSAPDNVNPSFDIDRSMITTALEEAKENLRNYELLKKNNFYKHAVLLDLNKTKLRKFLKVHTRHHLKIIDDILDS